MGVEGLAVTLAHQWNVDAEGVLLAALLHDYAKSESKQWLQDMLRECQDYPATAEDLEHPELWHGLVAAEIAKKQFGITDHPLRQAVAYHTTGTADYNPIGLCLYVADTLEPSRRFPTVEQHRRDILDLPMYQAAHRTAQLKLGLVQMKNQAVHSHTIHMIQWLDSYFTGENNQRDQRA